MKTILVVDDEKNYLVVMEALLTDEGYDVVTANNPRKAVAIVQEDPPDLLVTDMKMPHMSGLELMRSVKAMHPSLPVIILTAYGTVETAVSAMKEGADHYLLKPFDNDEMKLVVKRVLEMSSLAEEKSLLKRELSKRIGEDGFIGLSPPMKEISGLIEKIAKTRTTVLVEGESGTGKELVARAIHKASERNTRPFVAVNCGALTETLLESELFGHEKGAFTGATARRKGLFEMADGGTLFLDEVGTTSPALQVKLLRVLQERSFERVGGEKKITVDVRVIAASNRLLKELVLEGLFREDLLYRLNVFTIKIPPLRERREDIGPLASYFAAAFCVELGKEAKLIPDSVMERLYKYRWPGNVRELRNVIERAVVVSSLQSLSPSDLPAELSEDASGKGSLPGGSYELTKPLTEAVNEYEKALISTALDRAGGVQAAAARLLGISPTNLQYKLGKHKLNQP